MGQGAVDNETNLHRSPPFGEVGIIVLIPTGARKRSKVVLKQMGPYRDNASGAK